MSPSLLLYIGLMIFTNYIFYVVAISLINKRFNKIHINILAVLYFAVVILLSFFKSSFNFTGMNLNPFTMINDFKNYYKLTLLLVVSNTVIYLPLGVFIRFKIKIKIPKLIGGFLLYIVFVETLQYVSHTGIFDINDIILNTLGFVIGVYSYNLINRHNINYKQLGNE